MSKAHPQVQPIRTKSWLKFAYIVFIGLYLVQAYFVVTGIFPQSRSLGSIPLILAIIVGVSAALHAVMSRTRNSHVIFYRTIILELAALALLMMTTGFNTVASLALVFLLYESYRSYGQRGVVIASVILMIGAAIDISRAALLGIPNIADSLMIIIGIITISCAGGVVLRTQNLQQKILERSRSQAELERYRVSTLMNNLAQGVLSVDNKGIIRMYNAAALSILDTNGTLNGSHIDDIFKARDADNKRIKISSLMKRHKFTEIHDDIFYKYTDDTARLEVSITPIRVGRHHGRLDIDQGFIIMLRDITKQKNLDEERDEFISVVSHELRTPLTIAEGTLSNIEAMYEKGIESSDRIRTSLKAAHAQVVFLSKMVNDLSTLSRAERGVADTPEVINVKELLHNLYSEYNKPASEAKLALNIDLQDKLGEVKVSPLYLSELLHNLLTNAIKYTKEGSVTIAASRAKDTVTISVIDTGIGISKADKDKIFSKFYRSEDYRTRETRGTGLGLYVAMKLARKLDTKIELKSRLNHGSTFSITLQTIDE